MATFRALVVDDTVGPFWSSVLGFPLSDEGFLELPVDGMAPRRMWFNEVPESRVEPNRVRARLSVPDWDVDPLVELGAEVVDDPPDDEPWRLADPVGSEFEVVGGDRLELAGLIVDSHAPIAQARFWQRVLGGQISTFAGTADAVLSGVPSMPWGLHFAASDELKRVKNRWHWDVDLPAGVEVSELVKLGAAIVRPAAGEQWWTILVDPEGNEFCAFPPHSS